MDWTGCDARAAGDGGPKRPSRRFITMNYQAGQRGLRGCVVLAADGEGGRTKSSVGDAGPRVCGRMGFAVRGEIGPCRLSR